jgi:hypothetical protein
MTTGPRNSLMDNIEILTGRILDLDMEIKLLGRPHATRLDKMRVKKSIFILLNDVQCNTEYLYLVPYLIMKFEQISQTDP